VTEGAKVRLKQGNGEVVLISKVDDTVPVGCVRVAAAHPSTAALGEMYGSINVERA
jgi:NADH-quinone oxidoreductase subunit G